jgi:hypothetical protein
MQCVYWIHNENETDILTEGYVGISNDPQRRFEEHKDRFGSVKEVVFTFETRQEAKDKEAELRPRWNIGKNIAPGGQAGNRPRGIHTSGWKQNISEEKIEEKRLLAKTNERFAKPRRPFTYEGETFPSMLIAYDTLAERHGLKRGSVMYRIKNNVPLDKTQNEIMSVKTRENNFKRQKQ